MLQPADTPPVVLDQSPAHSPSSLQQTEAGAALDKAVANGASDLHITPGSPPVLRVGGRLMPLDGGAWGPIETKTFCRAITTDDQWREVSQSGTADFGLEYRDHVRFRVSVMRQRDGHAAVLRLIPNHMFTFEQIGLPEGITELLRRPRGLVLVTGPTGSGKTTTLATMIDWINQHLDRHIVTIEDPVEFKHVHSRSLVTQREVGVDVPDFGEAMRRALRQDPDVIMLGEMRDLETIHAAITAAETGHLVLGTLHTTGAAKTINRIIDAFPTNHQEQIRIQLSVSLAAVISQLLIPTWERRAEPRAADAPRRPAQVAAFEVMVATPAVANMIRTNDAAKLDSMIQMTKDLGSLPLDESLMALIENELVDADIAAQYAYDPAGFRKRIGR